MTDRNAEFFERVGADAPTTDEILTQLQAAAETCGVKVARGEFSKPGVMLAALTYKVHRHHITMDEAKKHVEETLT